MATVSLLDTSLAGQAPWGGVGTLSHTASGSQPSRRSPTLCVLVGPRFRLLHTRSRHISTKSRAVSRWSPSAQTGAVDALAGFPRRPGLAASILWTLRGPSLPPWRDSPFPSFVSAPRVLRGFSSPRLHLNTGTLFFSPAISLPPQPYSNLQEATHPTGQAAVKAAGGTLSPSVAWTRHNDRQPQSRAAPAQVSCSVGLSCQRRKSRAVWGLTVSVSCFLKE